MRKSPQFSRHGNENVNFFEIGRAKAYQKRNFYDEACQSVPKFAKKFEACRATLTKGPARLLSAVPCRAGQNPARALLCPGVTRGANLVRGVLILAQKWQKMVKHGSNRPQTPIWRPKTPIWVIWPKNRRLLVKNAILRGAFQREIPKKIASPPQNFNFKIFPKIIKNSQK